MGFSQISKTLFLTIQTALYLSFLLLDVLALGQQLSLLLKYSGIVLCFFLALTWASESHQHRLTATALAFTLLADLFLLLLNRWYLIGLLFFLIVQSLYLARIRLAGGWPHPICLTVRLSLPAAVLFALWTIGFLTPLNAGCAIYFSQLLCNALESRTLQGHIPWAKRFQAGLWLFIGCDLCVGLHNLALPLPNWLGWLAAVGMWAFYLPSQVLLTLSVPSDGTASTLLPIP